MMKGTPESANHSEYRFQKLLFVQNKLTNGFRSSFLCKTNKISVSGAPFCAKQFENRFQEFLKAQILMKNRFQELLKALFFLNRTKRSS